MPDNNNHAKRPLNLRPISTRRNTAAFKTTLAIGVSAALLANTATAQETTETEQEEESIMLDKLQIEDRTIDTNPYAEPNAPYKARISGDKRHVNPLAETPQTISVLTQTQIQESGRSDLKEILQTQPGITIGTGENGNAFGDRYIIRGHEARSDVFVDGVRDPGMTTRESFATEQIEITKGPSSTFAGRGSTGGAINGITKQASTEYNFTKLQAGVGTDDYRRFTLDSNLKINTDIAVRANLLHAFEDVPERDPADRERNGAAVSAAYQATDKLKLTGDFYYLKAADSPDLGTYIRPNGGSPVADIPVYLQNEDFLRSEVKSFTLRLNYEFNKDLQLENIGRYGTTDNGYVTTGARGTTRHDSDPYAPGAETISLSTHQGWQEVEYFVDQLNLYWDREIFGLKNQFVVSAEFSDLNVLNGVYNVQNTGASNCRVAGRGGASDGYCIVDGSGNTIADIGSLMGRSISKGDFDSDYSIQTVSLALMDTIDLSEHWSTFFGARMDYYQYDNTVVSRGATSQYSFEDDLWNYHFGVNYKINDHGNVYFTYSTSSNINGGESDVGGNCGYGGLCGVPEAIGRIEPESTQNLEMGTKWNVLNNKLLLTAALFQITKEDVMESVGDDYSADGAANTGRNRVRGIELSAVGNVTEQLSTQFGVAIMESEILASYNSENVGKVLSNFADNSAFLQLRYQMTPKFSFGGVMTYSSEMYTGQPDSAAGFNSQTGQYSYKIPSYVTGDLFATYEFTDRLKLRANINNISNKDYYLAGYRSGSFTYIGDRLNARFTLSYEF